MNMENRIMKQLFLMQSALHSFNGNELSNLSKVLIESGISLEELNEVNGFILEQLSPEVYAEKKEKQAMLIYIESFKNIQKLMKMGEGFEEDMANGYQEMAEINLEIAEDTRQLEDEGERLSDEVGTEKS